MDFISRTARTFSCLVIAVVFGCALVHVLAMLAVYATMAAQGDPMQVQPGLLAGAMWVGAMQGGGALLVAIPLGLALHFVLMRARMTGLLPYVGAALLVAAASAFVHGLFNGFGFNTAFAIMSVASSMLGGFMFWVVRRPDRG